MDLQKATKAMEVAEKISGIGFYDHWQDGGSQKRDVRYGVKSRVPELSEATEFHSASGLTRQEVVDLVQELNNAIAPVIGKWRTKFISKAHKESADAV